MKLEAWTFTKDTSTLDDSESDDEVTLGKIPWLYSVIICYIGFSLIGMLFYNVPIGSGFSRMIPILLLLFFLEEPDGRKKRDDLKGIPWLVVFLVYVLIYYGGGGIVKYSPTLLRELLLQILIFLGTIVIILIATKSPTSRLEQMGFRKGHLNNSIKVILIGIFLYTPVFFGFAADVSNLVFNDWINLLITTTLFPAIIEEVINRGVLQEAFSAKYDNRITGLVLASVIFGLGHTWTNQGAYSDIVLGVVLCFILQFAGGLILGGIYEKTDSIIPGIIIHYLYNAHIWMLLSNPELASIGYFGFILASVIIVLILALPKMTTFVEKSYEFVRTLITCIIECVQKKLWPHIQ